MIAEGGFSAVVEPSLETGRVLDAPLWGIMAEFGSGVSVMEVHKICDEKKHGSTARLSALV
jgi:hypothetical protein